MDMKSRADRIRYLRDVVLCLSQEELAAKLKVSRGSVGNWELGGGIGRKNLAALAALGGVSMEWIDTGKGEWPTERSAQKASQPSTSKALAVRGEDGGRESALIQGLVAAFGLSGAHAAELEQLLRQCLSEQSSGRSPEEVQTSRRDLVRFVTRQFLHSKGLKDGEG